MTSYMGIDVGTTATKVLVVNDDGSIRGGHGVAHPTARNGNAVEQNPQDWLDGIATATAAISERADLTDVAAIGVVSQVNTHVLVDAELRPVAPAVTWQDQRAAVAAAALDASLDDDEKQRLWGTPPAIDASFSLSRWRWWTEADEDATARSAWMLSPKDFCVSHITGVVATDAFTPIGLIGGDGTYLDDVLALSDGFAARQPPVRTFTAAAGEATGALGLPEGVPVAVGTMDAIGSVIGSGVLEPGMGFQVSGTSEIVGVSGAQPGAAPGVVGFPQLGSCFVQAGPTQAGGQALAWVAATLGLEISEALELADQADTGNEVLFLPHLDGERAPLWDPNARGVWLGMTNDTGPGELVRAVLEGVAFAARHIREVCETAAATKPARLRMSGGGSRSGVWNTIKATVHQRPLEVLATPDSGALGAALIGAVAGGDTRGLDALAHDLVRVDHVVEPDSGMQPSLDDRYDRYRRTYDALSPLFDEMAAQTDTPNG